MFILIEEGFTISKGEVSLYRAGKDLYIVSRKIYLGGRHIEVDEKEYYTVESAVKEFMNVTSGRL